MTENAETSPKKSRRKILLPIILIVVVAAGLWFFAFRDSNPGEAEVVTNSTDAPSEEKPGDDYEWYGRPDDPKKIIIPSIGVDGFVQNVGVDQDQKVAAPNNVHFAGWFVDSVRPGQKGLSIIDGHVDGRYSNDAIFKNLPGIAEGAEITVEFGDGSVKKFRVMSVKEAAEEDAAGVLFSQNPTTTSQLNLITCIGNFDEAERSYDKRFIVAAELI